MPQIGSNIYAIGMMITALRDYVRSLRVQPHCPRVAILGARARGLSAFHQIRFCSCSYIHVRVNGESGLLSDVYIDVYSDPFAICIYLYIHVHCWLASMRSALPSRLFHIPCILLFSILCNGCIFFLSLSVSEPWDFRKLCRGEYIWIFAAWSRARDDTLFLLIP